MPRALLVVLLALAACGGSHHGGAARAAKPAPDPDPDGPRRVDIVAQVQPYLDAELVDSVVVGIYDGGKREIYGLARPGSPKPDGKTLFELGGTTRVYTGLLYADGIARKEVALDTPLADTMPPGISVPVVEGTPITLRDLALHSAGFPRQPPHVRLDVPDPYAPYGEDILFADLVVAHLERAPGKAIVQSVWGYGLLGTALGRKLGGGGGYSKLMRERLLDPLALHDTFVGVPDAARARLVRGTDDDLQPVPAWHWGALAGAGAMVADARDLLALVDAELDAVAGSQRPLRAAMRMTQEPVLDRTGDNEAMGWQIDENGRLWQNGTTAGCHTFIGFDPKTRRGVVVLAATGLTPTTFDHIADAMYAVMANQPPPIASFPTPKQLLPIVGQYNLGGTTLEVAQRGNRFYLQGPQEKPMRLVPVGDREMWIEQLQTLAAFQREGDAIKAMVFFTGAKELSAPRIAAATPPAAPTPEPAPPAPTPARAQ